MSQGATPTQNNLKKVLRTALVGIKPADQVMIKGYLRVLLRLEADLEWVSANHPQVDLFMINNEFRAAASITKLLSDQKKTPVLYVSRTDIDEGWINHDRLILPLKKLDGLNEWLMTSVSALKQGAGAVTSILQQNEVKHAKAPVNSKKAVNDPTNLTAKTGSGSINRLETDVNHDSTADIQIDHSAQPSADYANLIAMIKQLNAKPEGFHQIKVKGQLSPMAIIAPKEGRVWCQNFEGKPISLNHWELMPYQGITLDPSAAFDLTQWLWQQAWEHSEELLALASDLESYQLSGWIKPELRDYSAKITDNKVTSLAKSERQALLAIMTAMETTPKSVNELAAAAKVSVKSAKKIIVSLLFSGNLQQQSYEKLDSRVAKAINPPLHFDANNKNDDQSLASASENIALTSQDLNDAPLLTSPTSTPSTIENPAPSTPATEPSMASQNAKIDSAQQQKMGFLSRLRRKLGI
ncbi:MULTISPECIES: hypothetical protein [Psychrobacter]|uniref:hypothetical protein n=1 Tax=Psychrobacter TaxID=497 RepID=UPI00146BCDF7|nr:MULTISPECIES: hypothetical protein [Psychrobacter]